MEPGTFNAIFNVGITIGHYYVTLDISYPTGNS